MKTMNMLVVLGLVACGDKQDKTEVKLCDNHTKVEIDPNAPKSKENGQAISDALMAQWKQQNPDVDWETDVRRSHPGIKKPADNSAVLQNDQKASQSYGQYTQADVDAWERANEITVLAGARVFHSGDELGSTIAVSCDMCHPDAANTHPETYPKFQPQMGRVVLLRDMINWCLEHPVRAAPMTADDPRMRAMEAYIYAQRSGTKLEYGKH